MPAQCRLRGQLCDDNDHEWHHQWAEASATRAKISLRRSNGARAWRAKTSACDEGKYASTTRAMTGSMPCSTWTNKAIRSGKAIGIYAPADVDDDDDTMYVDDGAGLWMEWIVYRRVKLEGREKGWLFESQPDVQAKFGRYDPLFWSLIAKARDKNFGLDLTFVKGTDFSLWGSPANVPWGRH
jgi:hypothetical protein